MHPLLKILFIFAATFLFSTCKKYPENPTFRNGSRSIEGTYFITTYNINGLDCLALLNTKYNRDIQKVPFTISFDDQGETIIRADFYAGRIAFPEDPKKLNICGNTFSANGGTLPYNFFVEDCGDWDILKKYVRKKIPHLKVQKQVKDRKVIIEFN